MNKWDWLTDTIPTGRTAAVSMYHLSNVHHMTERKMRLAVEKARRNGILICSSDKGYFLPETVDEIQEYTRRTAARLKTGRACLAPFLRELRKAGK